MADRHVSALSRDEGLDGPPIVLEVSDLRVSFESTRGLVQAVRGVSFSLRQGSTLAIVGESGSGKSASVLGMLRLVPSPPARIDAQAVLYRGTDLMHIGPKELTGFRGRELAVVFQDSQTALNPRMRIGEQIGEPLRVVEGLNRRAMESRVRELLASVRLEDAERLMRAYPHELSGGMRQRVMMACALTLSPRVLIADEPTTALDVTLQWEVMRLLDTLKRESDMSLILVTHDLALVKDRADDLVVMYGGRVVEAGPATEVLSNPSHPYTTALLRALPSTARKGALTPIKGAPPSMIDVGPGCSFAPRCPFATQRCIDEDPILRPARHSGLAACHNMEAASAAEFR